jgi:hypothetical protein
MALQADVWDAAAAVEHVSDDQVDALLQSLLTPGAGP